MRLSLENIKNALLIILICLIGLFIISIVPEQLDVLRGGQRVYRFAYPANDDIHKYDTANIDYAYQAVLLMNLYSPLVEYSSSGELIAGFAEKFYWENEWLVFEFRNNYKSSSGKLMDAYDAYLSIMRLLIKNSNTQGKLNIFFCEKSPPIAISDRCSDLLIRNQKLYIRVKNYSARKFILPLLASSDFGIIPRDAINFNSPNLEIADYSITSGSYYVSKTEKNENKHYIYLTANLFNHNFSNKMIKKIELVAVINQDSVKLFKDGMIDLITTVDKASTREIQQLKLQYGEDISMHRTYDIKVWSTSFMQRGMLELSSEERLSVGRIIKSEVLRVLGKEEIIEPAMEFFPFFGEAGLDVNERDKINKTLEKSKLLKIKKKIILETRESDLLRFSPVLKKYDFIELRKITDVPWNKRVQDQPHGIIMWGDTGFFENFSLVNYYVLTGGMGLFGDKAKSWLQSYISIPEKKKRLSFLRRLHFEALKIGAIVPIGSMPFVAAGKWPLKLGFYTQFAGTPFWMITIVN